MSRKEKKLEKELSLDGDIHANVSKILEIEETQRQNRTFGEKISEAIAVFCGSMVFVYVHVVWFAGWIVFNLSSDNFDPFPYTFLTLCVSLEAIFLSTFILISQNHEAKLTERRNQLDLQINMLAEQESTRTLELVQLIAKKVGVDCDDKKTKALLEPVNVEAIVKQIIENDKHDDRGAEKKE